MGVVGILWTLISQMRVRSVLAMLRISALASHACRRLRIQTIAKPAHTWSRPSRPTATNVPRRRVNWEAVVLSDCQTCRVLLTPQRSSNALHARPMQKSAKTLNAGALAVRPGARHWKPRRSASHALPLHRATTCRLAHAATVDAVMSGVPHLCLSLLMVVG